MKRRSAPPGRRSRRVAEQVRQVVTRFLQEEARDPRIGFVTVTGVEITTDLHYATVHYVVHGGPDEQVATQYGLGKAALAIRRRIGESLELRIVPELVFELDKGHEHATRIEQLLAGLKKPEEPPA